MTAEREASGEEGSAGAIMAKNGLAKASVAVSVLALVVAAASLLSARGRQPEEADGPDGLGELRAEITALSDSVKLCQAAVESSAAEGQGAQGWPTGSGSSSARLQVRATRRRPTSTRS